MSNNSYITKAQLQTILENVRDIILPQKVDVIQGKGLSTHDYTTADKTVVTGIPQNLQEIRLSISNLSASVVTGLDTKVDKISGKGLSTNDYDNEAKAIVDGVTAALNGKVDVIQGKGLSTNDFTNADKTNLDAAVDKLSHIDNNAQENVIESISVNGTTIQPDLNKEVAISVLTKSVNDLINYYTKSETYTQAEVNALIRGVAALSIRVVAELPTEDISTTTIYLVPSENPQAANIKDEYINITGTSDGWEIIGSTAIDLSDYYTKDEIDDMFDNIDLSGYYTKDEVDNLLENIDMSAKADKVVDAISGDLAGLDTHGNLTDSGIAILDIQSMQTAIDGLEDSSLQKVSAMPANPSNGDLVVWNGGNTYIVGHIYKYSATGPSETLYAWTIDNPGDWGDGVVIYTKLEEPTFEDMEVYKSDGTQYNYLVDDPSYTCDGYQEGYNCISVEIRDKTTGNTEERSANRTPSEDIIGSSGEWIDMSIIGIPEVSALTAEQDWKAVFGNDGVLTPNLNVADSSIFNSSDITIVDP